MKLFEILESVVKPRTKEEMTSPEVINQKYSMYSDDTIKKLAATGDFRAKNEMKKRKLSESIVTESADFKTLTKNKTPLTDDEHKIVMDAEAVWHHGRGGAASPAVWKSVDKNGKTTYVTNTHRAYNTAPTLKGAIGRYHKFIKSTA